MSTRKTRDYGCALCGRNVYDTYMVNDEVWREAMPRNKRGFLHLPCLEKKLGWRLTVDDFPPELPINEVLLFGYRLTKRGMK